MSINDGDDWFYPENGSNPATLDAQRFLEGAGWDDPDDPFQKLINDDVADERERVPTSHRSVPPGCACQPSAMVDAAVQLIERFENGDFPYPLTLMSIESFAGLGGPRNGPWSYWVNTELSTEAENGSPSIIKLWGCHRPGHHCSIHLSFMGNYELRELTMTVLDDIGRSPTEESVESVGMHEELEEVFESTPASDMSESVLEVISMADDAEDEDDDEVKYEERTFGDLDEGSESVEEDDENPDLVNDWQETVFSDRDIIDYTNAGLEPDEVLYLGRYMPWPEVSSWVSRFGHDSLLALELLRLGLGERSYNEEIDELDNDTLPGNVARVIQMAIHGHLRKMRSDQKMAKTNSSQDLDDILDGD